MKPLLLLDLDTTLLKTYVFWQDFANSLAQYSVQSTEKYIVNDKKEKLFSMDYETIISDFNSISSDKKNLIKMAMEQKSYLYDDARTLLKSFTSVSDIYDISVLTYGKNHIQRIKIDHTPELSGVDVHITQLPKAQYIKNNFVNRPYGALIDDKPDQNLPNKWLEINIDRGKKVYNTPVKIDKHIWQITNLTDALRIIE